MAKLNNKTADLFDGMDDDGYGVNLPTVGRFDVAGLAPENGIVKGMKDWIMRTAYIQMRDSVTVAQKRKLGMKQLSISEGMLDRIRMTVRRNKKKDWNNIRSYFIIAGMSLQRVQLLHYTATGEPCPPIILESFSLMYEAFTVGKNKVQETPNLFFRYTVGNTIVSKSDIMDIYANHEFTVPLRDLMLEIKDELHLFKDDDGRMIDMMREDIYCAEKWVIDSVNTTTRKLGELDMNHVEFPYTDEQTDAIQSILKSDARLLVLTGAGGTGKSVTIDGVIRGCDPSISMLVIAPTGMASKRLQDSDINQERLLLPISTMHSAVSRYTREDAPQPPDLIIIDESSMIDSEIFGRVVSTIADTQTKIILVGDPSQLPPVGVGQIFQTIIEHKMYPVFHLTKVLRTSNPLMLEFFQKIRDDVEIGLWEYPTFFKPAGDVMRMQRDIDTKMISLFEETELWHQDTTIVTFRNCVVDYINYTCYKHYTGELVSELETQDMNDFKSFYPIPWCWKGAKVVFLENDAELGVVNGDIGRIVSTKSISGNKRFKKYEANVALDNGKIVKIRSTYEQIKLAYAITIHKSQGSEYKHVIYVHFNRTEERRLVYTAITRARESFVVYVPSNSMIVRQSPPTRNTLLTYNKQTR